MSRQFYFTCILPVVDTIVSLRLLQVHFDIIPLLSLDLCYQPGSTLLQIYLGAHTNVLAGGLIIMYKFVMLL